MNPFESLLADLGNELKIGPLTLDEGGYVQLCFEEDLVVMIKVEGEPPMLTLFCRVGEAPDDHPDFAEELLSSNLFWRDTGGSTLSLERYSRSVILAKQFSPAALESEGVFAREMKAFIDSCREWILTIPRLSLPNDSGKSSRDNLMSAASR
jgi:hypothetical protein